MAHVSDTTPTPQQARAALAEAATRSAQVRKADKPLLLIPLVIAATYLAIGAVFALPWAHSGLIVLLILGAGIAGAIGLGARIRAHSRIGRRRFRMAVGVFSLWNGAVAGASAMLGWWAPGSPPWHFTVSTGVAVLPLLAATVLARWSRR
jgi:hypothetical protein